MTINVTVNNNVDKQIAVLARISSKVKTKATVRAINHTVRKLKTNTDKEIRKIYNIQKKAIKPALKTSFASERQAFARGSLSVSGRPIPLINFGAKPKNPFNVKGRSHKKVGGGVTVKIKKAGGKKLIPHAFIVTTKAGRPAVMMRANVKGAPKIKGGQKYDPPIATLRSVSLPSAFLSKAVNKAIVKLSTVEFNKEFTRQIELLNRNG